MQKRSRAPYFRAGRDTVKFQGVDAARTGVLIVVVVILGGILVVALALVHPAASRRRHAREISAYARKAEDRVPMGSDSGAAVRKDVPSCKRSAGKEQADIG